MKITTKDVRYVAELAHLELTDAEIESHRKELDAILTYIDQLNELDTSNVEPMTVAASSSPEEIAHALRDDTSRACTLTKEELAAAPDSAPPYFRVPKVIER